MFDTSEFESAAAAEIQDRDRRVKLRFDMEHDVRYKVLYGHRSGEIMSGKTTNISSGGIWFSTGAMLAPGTPLEISVSWPVLLHDACPMKLVIFGCVVRSNEQGAAAAIERYEFRTQRKSYAFDADQSAASQTAQQPAQPAAPNYRSA